MSWFLKEMVKASSRQLYYKKFGTFGDGRGLPNSSCNLGDIL
jgi:hypothetical protein